jgi:hypothetical protein
MNNQSIIKCKSKYEFVKLLVENINEIKNINSFQEKINKLIYLSNIEINKFYDEKSDTYLPTFNNRKFKINIDLFEYHFNFIESEKDYELLVNIGIEKLVKSFFKNNQIRKLINYIIEEENLICTINRIKNFTFKYNKEEVNLLPIKINKKKIVLNEECSYFYQKNLNDFILLCSIVFDTEKKLSLLLGNYKIEIEENEAEKILEKENNTIIFHIFKDSFTNFEDETLNEKIYNSKLGKIVYYLDYNLISKIEEIILENYSNKKIIKNILTILSVSVFDISEDKVWMFKRILNLVIESCNIDLNYEFLDTGILHNKTMTSKFFYNILSFLDNSTLFYLFRNSPFRIIDDYGIIQKNSNDYILKELVSRLKEYDIFDTSLRNFFNSLHNIEERIKILEIISNNLVEE